MIMPKGQSPQLHDAVVNVPVDVNKTCNLLPSTEHVIMVRLKKKRSFERHVFLSLLDRKSCMKH